MGETAAEQAALFQAEMARTGAAAGKPPSLKLQGRLVQQPSKRNNYQWVYGIDLRNISARPAELTVEWWIVGDTDIKHLNYLMAQGTEKVQLRSAGIQTLEFHTKSKSTYDNFADDLDELPAKGQTPRQDRARLPWCRPSASCMGRTPSSPPGPPMPAWPAPSPKIPPPSSTSTASPSPSPHGFPIRFRR
jgi:hypothetical protein